MPRESDAPAGWNDALTVCKIYHFLAFRGATLGDDNNCFYVNILQLDYIMIFSNVIFSL